MTASKSEKTMSGLLDLQVWQKFQDSLSTMTGLALITLDPMGRPLTEPSNVNSFCLKFLRRTPAHQGLCDKSHLKAAKAAASANKPVVYSCHAGFSYFAIPVLVNNVHVTTLVGGQVMRRDFDRNALKGLIGELKVEVQDFEGELQRIQSMTEEEFLKTKELIENLVGMITQLNFEKYGLSRKVAELSALHEIADLVGSVGDLDKMLRQLCEKIAQIAGIDRCALIVRDRSMSRILVVTSGKLEKEFRNSFIELTRDILFERRFLLKEPMVIERVEDIRDYGGVAELYKKGGITRRITVPLVIREHTLGLLEMYPPDDLDLTKNFTDMIIQVAHQTSVAIDNASIFSHAERLASTDGLTGLSNYRSFQHQMLMEVKRAFRYKLSLSMLILDIDNFKSVNDTYGHLIGNIALTEIADIIRSSVREVDIVARFGGEEFAVVMPETPLEGALVLAERLRKSTAEHKFPGPGLKTLRLTISVGVAEFVHGMKTREELLEAADTALLRAKSSGKDIVIYAGQPDEAKPKKPAAAAKKTVKKAPKKRS